MASKFITIIIYINLDIGFDICFMINHNATSNKEMRISKALLLLWLFLLRSSFLLLLIVISEYSSKIAKIIGKGNPVSVLATMILLSYAKILMQFLLQSLCCTYNLLTAHVILMLKD